MLQKFKNFICKVLRIKQCQCSMKKTNKFLNEGI